MKINHSAANEQEKAKLLAPGDYTFQVISSEAGKSKKGQDMFTLKLAVYDADGRKRPVKDWVGEWDWTKLKGLCDSVGLSGKYADGEVDAEDLIDTVGRLKIKHAVNTMNGKNELKVAFYIPVRPGSAPVSLPAGVAVPPPPPADTEDDVPF